MILMSVLVLLFSCVKRNDPASDGIEGHDVENSIVLMNLGHYGRDSLTLLVNTLSKCNPKVIGLNVRFKVFRANKEDTLLAQSFQNSGKVVLADALIEDHISESHYFFSSKVRDHGVLIFAENEDSVATDYMQIYEDNHGQRLNFPFLLAVEVDHDHCKEKFENFLINRDVKITYRKRLSDFKILDGKNISCEDVEDKIVLIGFLGPENDDLYKTPLTYKDGNQGADTWGTVIAANIILDLLN